MLGFALVGGAVLMVVGGRLWAKIGWLLTDMAAVFALNVGRLVAVFVVAGWRGQDAALRWLHPCGGLVLFGVAVAAMTRLLPRFGLTGQLGRRPAPAASIRAEPSRLELRHRGLTLSGVTVLVVAALALGSANGALQRFEPFAGVLAAGPGSRPLVSPPVVGGLAAHAYDQISWAPQFFGAGATWTRFQYDSPSNAPDSPIWMDVVSTSDLAAFSRFGLEECYRFHGYRIVSSGRVGVGGLVPAQAITYWSSRDHAYWSVVAWVRPVAAGGTARFERIVLLSAYGEAARRPSAEANTHRAPLVAFARQVVQAVTAA